MTYAEAYSYVYDKKSYFPSDKLDDLMEMLMDCDDDAFKEIKKAHFQSPVLITLLSIVLGIYGVDRFVVGDYKLGLFKLFTGGGFLAMWLVDIFKIGKDVQDYNYIKICQMSLPSMDAVLRDFRRK